MQVIDNKNGDYGTLKDFGIDFEFIDYNPDEEKYLSSISGKLSGEYKVIYIQRSRGYSIRKSLSIS